MPRVNMYRHANSPLVFVLWVGSNETDWLDPRIFSPLSLLRESRLASSRGIKVKTFTLSESSCLLLIRMKSALLYSFTNDARRP